MGAYTVFGAVYNNRDSLTYDLRQISSKACNMLSEMKLTYRPKDADDWITIPAAQTEKDFIIDVLVYSDDFSHLNCSLTAAERQTHAYITVQKPNESTIGVLFEIPEEDYFGMYNDSLHQATVAAADFLYELSEICSFLYAFCDEEADIYQNSTLSEAQHCSVLLTRKGNRSFVSFSDTELDGVTTRDFQLLADYEPGGRGITAGV